MADFRALEPVIARPKDRSPVNPQIATDARRWIDAHPGTSYSEIDCSHYVWEVIKMSRPGQPYLNSDAIAQSGLFREVDESHLSNGDIVYWPGHVAIVTDVRTGKFMGSQTSTGPAETNYKSNPYWAGRPGRKYFTLN